MNLDQAETLGFDASYRDGEYVRIKCHYCEALVINGVPCHETGCTNQTHECFECGTPIPKRARLCESCANPDDFNFEQVVEDV